MNQTDFIEQKIDQANYALLNAKLTAETLSKIDFNNPAPWIKQILSKFIVIVKVYGDVKKSCTEFEKQLGHFKYQNGLALSKINRLEAQLVKTKEQKAQAEFKFSQILSKNKKIQLEKEAIMKEFKKKESLQKNKIQHLEKQLISKDRKLNEQVRKRMNKQNQIVPPSKFNLLNNVLCFNNQSNSPQKVMFESLKKEHQRNMTKISDMQTILQTVFQKMNKITEALHTKNLNEKLNKSHDLNVFSYQATKNQKQSKIKVLRYFFKNPLQQSLTQIQTFFYDYQNDINFQLRNSGQRNNQNINHVNTQFLNPEEREETQILKTMINYYCLLATQFFKFILTMTDWIGLDFKNGYELVTPGIFIDPNTEQAIIQLSNYNQQTISRLNDQVMELRNIQRNYVEDVIEIQKSYQQQFDQSKQIYQNIKAKKSKVQDELKQIFAKGAQIVKKHNSREE